MYTGIGATDRLAQMLTQESYCMVVSSSTGTRSMRKVVSAKESVRAMYLPEVLSPVFGGFGMLCCWGVGLSGWSGERSVRLIGSTHPWR